ncbi:protein phosphatase 2C domain-containing protein [Pseudoflavitalea sp. G-6-1-2]|uniref:PP2C family serine/threonine-protein phosphatase n=1 Tax=Pseudoflavitalea sp. G-6-1-2 TaxID=2728841 RepID=UPI00146C2E7D|nr:PP2C family serine/threonine-protein phosphatase [Pseudoflavitalea sp. G-6-1-2]NML20095.1 protein phosphatase 2C domain-containing protein [Pseudoflavitalea sp. G-6-1-2]
MSWKIIAQSVTGTSHLQSARDCEDAHAYAQLTLPSGEPALICCVSDGAGSAKHAAAASKLATTQTCAELGSLMQSGIEVDEAQLLTILESVYDQLLQLAEAAEENINEYSCTLLGAVITSQKAIFFQVGDGALIREDNNDGYAPIWWPQNGEYSNSTSFLVDDANMSHLRITTLQESIREIAILTDGLQLLTLNNESMSVHQPFFADLFKWLRKATEAEHLAVLNRKLGEYLNSDLINSRTDDDKTLFLATRI